MDCFEYFTQPQRVDARLVSGENLLLSSEELDSRDNVARREPRAMAEFLNLNLGEYMAQVEARGNYIL